MANSGSQEISSEHKQVYICTYTPLGHGLYITYTMYIYMYMYIYVHVYTMYMYMYVHTHMQPTRTHVYMYKLSLHKINTCRFFYAKNNLYMYVYGIYNLHVARNVCIYTHL